METDQLFLATDAALRSVIDRIAPEDFDKPVPAGWTQSANPTILDILRAHAYDEAWVPAVIAGASVADGDELRDRDLLGDDPIAAYDTLNDAATAAVQAGVDGEAIFRFQYGDYPAKEGFAHLAMYRGFQAWLIAKHLSIPFHLSPELIAGMNEHVVPNAEQWRSFGVFPPAIDPPDGADDETRLLCTVGFWIP
ncbi:MULTISPECIES: hypothetical protein [Arthrobacter]|uniref:TIGR03086 family protein n=1 Tax=Arthrobacter psychrochitiniphilus TaxID=291045 RepID=A0A2V3DTI8_9MICC|nr:MULTISPECIES: hypothetical protein [Arthrobacter]NYG18833.1 hypothetical protein [Arthrobacter psychrochitiniphilus]PXA66254.1 hypothetical protein CVS29_06015 [Arthrobacter psychrochitiniphilus]